MHNPEQPNQNRRSTRVPVPFTFRLGHSRLGGKSGNCPLRTWRGER